MGWVKFQRGRVAGQCSINPEGFQQVVLVPTVLEVFSPNANLLELAPLPLLGDSGPPFTGRAEFARLIPGRDTGGWH